MDACVFFDLVAPNPKPVAQQLRADWLDEHVRFGVTDHLFAEITKGKDRDERRRQRAEADPLRLSPTPGRRGSRTTTGSSPRIPTQRRSTNPISCMSRSRWPWGPRG
jgi:hypothetical protein